MCFAKHPFQDSQKLAIVNAHYYLPDEDHKRIGTKLRDLVRLMLTPDPSKRPNIEKILSILENWDEIDHIPLNDEAFKIKSKHEALYEAKNTKYKDLGSLDLLGFNDAPTQSKHITHCKFILHLIALAHSVSEPKITPPINTGWADFGTHSFSTSNNQPQVSKEENWFDFVGGFGSNGAKEEVKQEETKPDDMTWGFFDFDKAKK